jgi:hypothetical protein
MSTTCSLFSCWFLTFNFSSVLIGFRRLFNCISTGDADLHLSYILETRANDIEGAATSAVSYHQCNQSIHVTDGMTVTTLSSSLQHKATATMDCVCQMTLNRKLSHKSEKWLNSEVALQRYRAKRYRVKRDLPVLEHLNPLFLDDKN